MECHAFVLHLTRASARKANAHELVEICRGLGGVDHAEIWPAVDGTAMSSTDLEDVVGAELFQPTYPFALKTGEIGCFLSHRQIWAEMQNRDAGTALIIEDDAGLEHETFRAAVTLARANIDKLGYIQLQTRPPTGPAALSDTNDPCHLTVPRLGGLRTTAQMISKDAAAHLLRLSEVIDRPVDTFVQSHWHTLLRPAVIYPSGVVDIADQLDGSTIQAGRKSLLEKIGREFARGRYRRGVDRLSRASAAPTSGGFSDE